MLADAIQEEERRKDSIVGKEDIFYVWGVDGFLLFES